MKSRPTVFLVAGLVVFLGVLVYLVVSSLTRRSATTFSPSPVGVPLAGLTAGGSDTVTIDARDENRWRYLDLDAGIALAVDDSTGWDLAMQRFRIRAARGGDLGKWYSYGALSHLLEPAGQVYEVRTDGGRIAQVEILSYYCPGLAAGCLTFRYRLLPEAPPR